MPVTVSTPAAQDAALSLSRPRPALRLVSTKGLARETWLDVRRQTGVPLCQTAQRAHQ